MKIEDGYPKKFTKHAQDHEKVKLGCDGPDTPVIDFYESLCVVSKVHTALEVTFDKLCEVHRPENGFVRSSLENSVTQYAIAKLRLSN